MTDSSYTFETAGAGNADSILALYRSVMGGDFCTWNEFYPATEEIRADYESCNLFVLKDGAKIVGAISIVPENELDDLEFWEIRDGSAAEIARVAVSPEYQGSGLALRMVLDTEKILKDRGCRAVHLLAAKINIPACYTYQKAGYRMTGECDMYGHRFCAYENEL
jgi:ribosomal protein S18 acetylase RimI-like enzyme